MSEIPIGGCVPECEQSLFLSVQASTVSETWDANAVSRTLDGRAR